MEIRDNCFEKQVSISRWASVTVPQTINYPSFEMPIILSHTHVASGDKAFKRQLNGL